MVGSACLAFVSLEAGRYLLHGAAIEGDPRRRESEQQFKNLTFCCRGPC
jgi:hypothetical protein